MKDLLNRPSSRDAYNSAMDYPKKMIEKRFSELTLDNRPVVVHDYASKNDVDRIHDALTTFDPDFRVKYRSKSQLKKMPWIQKLLESSDHCRQTPYTFELRLCGKDGCNICARINRTPRTPNVMVNGKNLRAETIRWLDLPIPNPSDGDHYSPHKEAWKMIEKRAHT